MDEANQGIFVQTLETSFKNYIISIFILNLQLGCYNYIQSQKVHCRNLPYSISWNIMKCHNK